MVERARLLAKKLDTDPVFKAAIENNKLEIANAFSKRNITREIYQELVDKFRIKTILPSHDLYPSKSLPSYTYETVQKYSFLKVRVDHHMIYNYATNEFQLQNLPSTKYKSFIIQAKPIN